MVKWSVPIALEMGFEYQAQPQSTEWYKSRLRGNQAKHLKVSLKQKTLLVKLTNTNESTKKASPNKKKLNWIVIGLKPIKENRKKS